MRKEQFLPVLVLTIAVVIGVIGKIKPELFLKIPRVGFIPWALTGHPIAPYFDEACLYQENWSGKKGDIVVSSGVKAGTLWLHTIIFLLRSNGWDGFDELKDQIGSCELLEYPEETLSMRLEKTAWKRAIAEAKGVRGFQHFTHKFPGQNSTKLFGVVDIPRQSPELYGVDPELNPDIKYIALVRNGKEVLNSFLAYVNLHSDKFRKMWGGYPLRMGGPHDFVPVSLLADSGMREIHFDHLKAWWERKHLPNVLLVHYRNLRTNPAKVIQQIAEFLEIPLTDQLRAQVLLKSSLQYMTHPSRTTKYEFIVGYPEDRFPIVGKNQHIRPQGGHLENGKDQFLSEDTVQLLEAAIQKHLGHDPDLVEFANTGVMPE